MINPEFFTQRLKSVDLHEAMNRAIEANGDFIADQNTNQLAKGEDSKGVSLGEYANYDYKNRWSPVDLRQTGDFWRSIRPKTEPESFQMEADDWKTGDLIHKYGEPILGLNPESVQMTGEIILEDFISNVKKEIANE